MWAWCIVTLASARLKASVRFLPLRGMYQRGGTCKGCDTMGHIEPFQYADPDTAFLEEDVDSYGDLWQFKSHITQYTFGIAKQKGYVFLRYKIDDIPQFYTWNMKEKKESIEDHHKHFIVIVLREVDDNGNATSLNHSIVIDVRQQHGKFDVVTLMAALQGTDMDSLNEDFISKQLPPWQEKLLAPW